MTQYKKTKTEFGYMYQGFYIEKQNDNGFNWRLGDWLVYTKNYWEGSDYDTSTEDYINWDVPKTLREAMKWVDSMKLESWG